MKFEKLMIDDKLWIAVIYLFFLYFYYYCFFSYFFKRWCMKKVNTAMQNLCCEQRTKKKLWTKKIKFLLHCRNFKRKKNLLLCYFAPPCNRGNILIFSFFNFNFWEKKERCLMLNNYLGTRFEMIFVSTKMNLLKPQISEIKAAFFGICVYQFVNETLCWNQNNILCSEIVQYFYGSDPSPHFLFVCFFPPFFITITTVLYIFWLLLLLLYTFLSDVVFWLKLLFFMYSFQHFFVILQSFLLVFFCCVVYFPYFPVIKMFFLEFFLCVSLY